MTGQSTTSEQKRLDSCVLSSPKWAKTHEKLENRACRTVKIDDLTANAVVRIENNLKNAQVRRNTKLLGKYQYKYVCVPPQTGRCDCHMVI